MGIWAAYFSLNGNMEIELQPKGFRKTPESKEDCSKVTILERLAESYNSQRTEFMIQYPSFYAFAY